MLKIAVCDDNPKFLASLCEKIKSVFKEDHMLYSFSGANELMSFLYSSENCKIDIVITDISMPLIDGVKMARELKQRYSTLQFIFVTAYTDYIQDVFSVNPIYYILKPIEDERLIDALQKAAHNVSVTEKQVLHINEKNSCINIRYCEILYAESFKHKVYIHEFSNNTELTVKLDEIEKMLPQHFIRCHKSYLVNMNYIRKVNNNFIELYNGKSIPVAKSKYKKIKATIIQYFGGNM